jgi:hypothetical protein
VCALREWYLKKKATTPPTQTHPNEYYIENLGTTYFLH